MPDLLTLARQVALDLRNTAADLEDALRDPHPIAARAKHQSVIRRIHLAADALAFPGQPSLPWPGDPEPASPAPPLDPPTS